MDLDPGDRRDTAATRAEERHAGAVQRVRDAVGEHRMDARPGGQDLERPDVSSRWIAGSRGADVARTSVTMRPISMRKA